MQDHIHTDQQLLRQLLSVCAFALWTASVFGAATLPVSDAVATSRGAVRSVSEEQDWKSAAVSGKLLVSSASSVPSDVAGDAVELVFVAGQPKLYVPGRGWCGLTGGTTLAEGAEVECALTFSVSEGVTNVQCQVAGWDSGLLALAGGDAIRNVEAVGAVDELKVQTDEVGVLPTVGGEELAVAKVFDKAKSDKPVTFPKTPVLVGAPGVRQTVVYRGEAVSVPVYYNASLAGSTMSVALNTNACDGVHGFSLQELGFSAGKVSFEIGSLHKGLYYAILTSDTPAGKYALPSGGAWRQATSDSTLDGPLEAPATADRGFYRVSVTDVRP